MYLRSLTTFLGLLIVTLELTWSKKTYLIETKDGHSKHSSHKADHDYIIGGKDAKEHEWPFMVAIVMKNGNLPTCGGALISDRHVLTAAHCFHGNKNKDTLQVLVGEHKIKDQEATRIDMENVLVDEWDKVSANRDLAIVTLKEPVTKSDKVQPVCLASDNSNDYQGKTVTLKGWGVLKKGGKADVDQPDNLQQIEMKVISKEDCLFDLHRMSNFDGKNMEGLWEKLPSRIMCVQDPTKTVCHGDSGGPVALKENGKWKLVAVVSQGVCIPEIVSTMLAKVAERYDWIKTNTQGTCT